MAAQSITQGLRDTVTAQGSEIIPPGIVQNRIDLLTKEKAPWMLVTRTMNKKKPRGDWSFYIYQDLLLKRKTTLAAAVAVAATTWNVATGTGDYITGWDTLWNRTRNVFAHVQSVSTDAVTVVANIDGGTDTAGQIGDEVWILGNSTQESGGLTQAMTTTHTRRTNYMQDVMTPLSYSDMATLSDYFFDGKDVTYQKLKYIIEHQRKLEMQCLLGGLAALKTPSGTYANPTRSGSYRFGLTFGFRGFMNAYADTDHIKTDTDLTESEFMDNLEYAFHGEDEGQTNQKMELWAPQRLYTKISKWNIGRQRFTDTTSKNKARAGLRFRVWESPFGPVNFFTSHDLQSTVSGGTHMYFLVDRSRIGWVPYNNLDTHIVELPPDQNNPKTKVFYTRTVGGSFYTHENAHFFGQFVT